MPPPPANVVVPQALRGSSGSLCSSAGSSSRLLSGGSQVRALAGARRRGSDPRRPALARSSGAERPPVERRVAGSIPAEPATRRHPASGRTIRSSTAESAALSRRRMRVRIPSGRLHDQGALVAGMCPNRRRASSLILLVRPGGLGWRGLRRGSSGGVGFRRRIRASRRRCRSRFRWPGRRGRRPSRRRRCGWDSHLGG